MMRPIVAVSVLFGALLLHGASSQARYNETWLAAKHLGNNNGTRLLRVVPIMFGKTVHLNDNVVVCSESIDEFPVAITDVLRKDGAIALAVIIAVYCFTAMAIICDSYFLPCVARICESLSLSQDVAAATFMAIATSAPELFVNVIGTFVTESDIGIGTVVGSSMFNTLGVASIGGLAAKTPIQLDWWPLTRDTIIYVVSILILVTLTWDGEIRWHESLVLFGFYFVYLTLMFQNDRISRFFRGQYKKLFKRKISEQPITRGTELSIITMDDGVKNFNSKGDEAVKPIEMTKAPDNVKPTENKQEEQEPSIFKMPEGHWVNKLFFFYSWPIKFILFCTVPDCKKHEKVYPLTFIMCVVWIGSNSYMVSWMITIIGYTLGIPDSVLGLTFLAAGGCLPEAISITITSRKGEGSMGVSNSLGANTMNILLSLGFPWFIKTSLQGSDSIRIVSGSIEYTIIALILVAVTLFVTLTLNKFRLSRVSGAILITTYAVYLVLAILSELVFFEMAECSDVS